MEYNLLLSAYNELLIENKKLKEENDELKRKFGLANTEEPTIFESDEVKSPVVELFPMAKINKSSETEKINLFMSLFRGREDVFARRWYSPTSNKSGYQPVCQNEWDKDLCDKRKYKCNVCPNITVVKADNI